MQQDPPWSSCLHLSAGTCPQMAAEGQALAGGSSPRPELTQDLALARLEQACATCRLNPGRGKQP